MPEVEFLVCAASVPLVDGDEGPVARVVQEEATCVCMCVHVCVKTMIRIE